MFLQNRAVLKPRFVCPIVVPIQSAFNHFHFHFCFLAEASSLALSDFDQHCCRISASCRFPAAGSGLSIVCRTLFPPARTFCQARSLRGGTEPRRPRHFFLAFRGRGRQPRLCCRVDGARSSASYILIMTEMDGEAMEWATFFGYFPFVECLKNIPRM